MTDNKLDKLYNLRFYRSNKQWRSKKPELDRKRKKNSTNQQNSHSPLLTKQKTGAVGTSTVQEYSKNNAEMVDEPPATTFNSVSHRLDLLMQSYKSIEISDSSNNNSEEQNHTPPSVMFAESPLDSSRFSTEVICEDNYNSRNVTMDDGRLLTEDQMTHNNINENINNVTDNDNELNSDDPLMDTDFVVHSQYDDDEIMSRHDRSYILFMRGIHDAPHSSMDEDQLDTIRPEDINFRRLAEMSTRQLCHGVTRFATAARILWREMAMRSLLREFSRASGRETYKEIISPRESSVDFSSFTDHGPYRHNMARMRIEPSEVGQMSRNNEVLLSGSHFINI